jgi:cytochrome c peroxidase
VGVALLATAGAAFYLFAFGRPAPFSDEEIAHLRALALDNLPPLAPDSTNRVADLPAAQRLGHRLFFDTRLSGNGAISCATCHQPARRFTDGLQTSRAIGISKRNAPSLIGTAYSPFFYWDGRRDSLWAQALSPLEDPAEHGSHRLQIVSLVARHPDYRAAYEAVFPPVKDIDRLPPDLTGRSATELARMWQSLAPERREAVNQAFANVGKAIAAYERLLLPGMSRFDRFVAGLTGDAEVSAYELLSSRELRGLRLFIGKANCTQCHNGPLLTNGAFHNTGMLSRPGNLPDTGRAAGLRLLQADPFNCLGRYSDDRKACGELEFARVGPENVGAMKTPSLRNLAGTQPYAHAGQQAALAQVLRHYNDAPDAMIGHNEAKPLELWPWELGHLEAFLGTLDAPPATADTWLQAPTSR